MRTPTDDQVNYFGEKAAKRMKDFAIHNYKQPLDSRGRNCMESFRKNSNPEWSQQFFILVLECWVNWIGVARSRPSLKGSKKIMKSFESIEKYNIELPRTLRFYNQINMQEPEPTPQRAQNNTTAPINQGGAQTGNGRNGGNPPITGNPSRQSNVPKVDEAKVTKSCDELRTIIIESANALPQDVEDAEILQVIIGQLFEYYNSASKLYEAVLNKPEDYQDSIVQTVKLITNAIDSIETSYEKFSNASQPLDKFLKTYYEIVTDLQSSKKSNQSRQAPPVREETHKAQVELPKKEDKPVTNIDMNSYMSAAMNQKARQDDEEGDDDIQLPDWNMPDEYEDKATKNKTKPTKIDDPFEANSKDFEDNDEHFQYQAEEMEDSFQPNMKANEESKASLKNQSDRKVQPISQKGDSKFRFNEDDEEDKKDHIKLPKDSKTIKQKPDSLKLSHISDSYQYSRDETPKPDKSSIKSPQVNTEQPGDFNYSGTSQKNQNKKTSKLPVPEKTSEFLGETKPDHFQNRPSMSKNELKPAKEDQKGTVGSPKPMSEEEKIKLAQKNQKALEDPKTQTAINDFFQGGDEQPASIADIFARAKLRTQQGKGKNEDEIQSKPKSDKKLGSKMPESRQDVRDTQPRSSKDAALSKKIVNNHTETLKDEIYESKVIKKQIVHEEFEEKDPHFEQNPDAQWDMDPDAQEFFQTDDFFKPENNLGGVDFADGFFGNLK